MSLTDAIKKLTDGIVDLTDLEVTTFTGTLASVVDAASGELRWDEIKPGSGKVMLAAATLVRPNGNTVNFRAAGLDAAEARVLFELHTAACDSARAGRASMIQMFSGLAPKVGR